MSAPAMASAGSEPLLAKVSPMARTVRPGREPCGLGLPVAHHAGGGHHQERARRRRRGCRRRVQRRRTPPFRQPCQPAPAACSLAAQISASACTVLPRPMSSASTPPRPCRYRKLSQLKPSSWYGRSSALRVAGSGRPFDAAFQQPAHGLAPGGGLLVHDAQLRQFVPEPGLEPADLQRRVLVVLQYAGLVDQRPQLVQFGQVQGEVGAAGQQHAWSGRRPGRRNSAAKDTGWPSRVITMPRSNQSPLLGGLGGDGHHRGLLGLAVVGDVAGGVHGDAGEFAEPGEHLLGEGQGVQAAEFGRGRQPRRAPAAGGGFAQRRHHVPGLADGLEDAGLGGVVAVAVVAGVAPQRLRRDEVAGLVVPFPVQPDPVVGAVIGQQRQGGNGQRGQLHGLVRRRDPGGSA